MQISRSSWPYGQKPGNSRFRGKRGTINCSDAGNTRENQMAFEDPTADSFLADQAKARCRELIKSVVLHCEKTGEDPVEALNEITKRFELETKTVKLQIAGHSEVMAKLLADMDAAGG